VKARTGYGAVRHLHGILREKIVVVLELIVYGDESGIHDKTGLAPGSEVTAVAGYVARKRDWEIVSRRWKTALRKYGVEVFHMSDYWRKKPPYDKWTDAKRKRFLRTLIKIARDNTWFAIGGMVSSKDFADLAMPGLKGVGDRPLDHAYHFCLQMFFVRFMEHLKADIDRRFEKQRFKEQVAFIFDQQQQFAPVALAGFQAIKDAIDPDNHLGTMSFGSKDKYIPLQAADLLAFYARRILTHQMQRKSWRDPFERMMEERHNLLLYYFTRDQLIHLNRMVAEGKLARRDDAI
jgi:Protein of unknown function (DUF3800)